MANYYGDTNSHSDEFAEDDDTGDESNFGSPVRPTTPKRKYVVSSVKKEE